MNSLYCIKYGLIVYLGETIHKITTWDTITYLLPSSFSTLSSSTALLNHCVLKIFEIYWKLSSRETRMVATIIITGIGFACLALIGRLPRWFQFTFWILWIAAWCYFLYWLVQL